MNKNRIDEFFWLFGTVFPFPQSQEKRQKFEVLTGGIKLETAIPQMLKIISQLIQDNQNDAEMWFRFFKEGIDYMNETSYNLPEVSIPQEEISRLMRIQLKNEHS